MNYLLFAPFDSLLGLVPDLDESLVFSPAEAAELAGLHVPARIREWKASRIAAKVLARAAYPGLEKLPFPEIQTFRQPSGAPCLVLGDGTPLPGVFSQSHSHGFIFSGICMEDQRFGIDLEFIESRSEVFINDFFTSEEAGLCLNAPLETCDVLATLIWSAKEAVLKAAALGLKLDTRKVEITPQGDFSGGDSWQFARVNCPDLKLQSPGVYWKQSAGFIQTVCVDSTKPFQPVWVEVGDQDSRGINSRMSEGN